MNEHTNMSEYTKMQEQVDLEFDDAFIQENARQQLEETNGKRDGIILYDTITGKKIAYKRFVNTYDKHWADIYLKYELKKKRVPQDISRKFYLTFISTKTKPKKHKSGLVLRSGFEKESWIKVPNTIYKDNNLGRIMVGKTELYFHLRSSIVRQTMKKDKLNLFNDYYKEGFLAASITKSDLAKWLHMGKLKISNYLDILVENKILILKEKLSSESWDKKPHDIYIFGIHNGLKNKNYVEEFYIDTIKT